jgi:hypothetical protein
MAYSKDRYKMEARMLSISPAFSYQVRSQCFSARAVLVPVTLLADPPRTVLKEVLQAESK